MAIAIVVSLVVSLFIAQTVIPLLATRLDQPSSDKQNKWVERLKHRYVRLLGWTLRHRWAAAAMVILTLASAVIPMSIVETDMFPMNQTRKLYLSYHLDGHYPLEKIKESVDRIEDYLYANQEEFEIRAVYTYYDETGSSNTLSAILLTEDDEAKLSSEEISKRIMEGLPKIAIGKPSFSFERTGGAEKLNITLMGSSSEVLGDLAEDAERILSTVEGISGVVSEAGAGDEEVQVRVDREKANLLGFSTQDVAQAVAIALRGVELREFKGEEGEVPVRLQLREEDRENLSDLKDIKLRNAAGLQVPLMALVRLTQNSGPDRDSPDRPPDRSAGHGPPGRNHTGSGKRKNQVQNGPDAIAQRIRLGFRWRIRR